MANKTDAKSLYDLLGSFDNLQEPRPFVNRREFILGIVITFMVGIGNALPPHPQSACLSSSIRVRGVF